LLKKILEQYLKNLTDTFLRGDAREESYYIHLDEFIRQYAEIQHIQNVDITILPKKTEAGNPDFRIWDGKNRITGYIEAKDPSATNLDSAEVSEQLKRYCSTFPNVILTNFYEFRLYRNGERIAGAMIGRPIIAQKLRTAPPAENVDKFQDLFEKFFSFSLPKVQTAHSLALELAKRTRFLRDEVMALTAGENGSKGNKQIRGFYEAFQKYLIGILTEKQFADLYAQTLTYGLFAARTRAEGEFTRRIAFDCIPHTIGFLRDIFRFVCLEEPPLSLRMIVEDIAEILHVTDTNEILHEYRKTGKGRDPVVHFYESFLSAYDPETRERRGVYYTPEAVVGYIVRSVHSILKSNFGLADGLASPEVKLLDPAGGTLTFPAEAVRVAAAEFQEKYGRGGLHQWIRSHILENFCAFELMMAPYAVGHLKMGFVLDELGYRMADEERFRLYLTNTLEMREITQTALPGLSSLSEESHLAGMVKTEQPVLVIVGNPPYSGISANINEWTERLLKEDIDGAQSYYKVDGLPLREKKVWLQDDYVKFLRFAQWKIHKSGYGIVGMITNHGYLDNPTFRGMRQSLMKTFDEIYLIDLHGNSLKKETSPDGGKDENVFDIRQGVAIALFVRNKKAKKPKVFHADLHGLRNEKYRMLDSSGFDKKNYREIKPVSPGYFFVPKNTSHIQHYLKWKQIDEIFQENVTGIVTARDNLAVDFEKNSLRNKIMMFRNLNLSDDVIRTGLNLKDNYQWKMAEQRKQFAETDNWEEYFSTFLYRPFDVRHIYYHENIVFRTRHNVMHHMREGNIGLIVPRQCKEDPGAFITENLIGHKTVSAYDINYLFPLYVYGDKNAKDILRNTQIQKRPNISQDFLEKMESVYRKKPKSEDILYYIYGIFYSNIYRKTYAEFLKTDFPRVPFTSDYSIFRKIGKMGKELADLHLLKSPALNPPLAKYQGSGDNDRIEKIAYNEKEQRVYINKDRYFEGITPELWNYHIGGYQVLSKYLKDRKGRIMDDAPHYCRVVTAIFRTLEIQEKVDKIYPDAEKETADFF